MAWTAGSFGFHFLMTLVVTAILARLLAPDAFGLVGMTSVVINFLLLFRGQGINAALVQSKEPTDTHLSSAFWLLAGSGALISALVVLLSPVLAWLYSEPRLVPIVALAGVPVFLSSLAGCHSAVLQREGAFRTIALREMLGQLLGGAVAVAMAFAGFGVFALVFQGIAGAFFSTLFLWIAADWRPTLTFRRGAIRDLLGFGASVTGFQMLNYVYRNLDVFLVGRLLGSAPLGFYTMGQRTIRMASDVIGQAATKVMYPTLARIDDVARFRRIFVEANRLLAAALYLPMVALLVLAEPVVSVLLGPAWGESVPLVRLFAVAGLLQVTGSTLGWVYQARGRPDLMLRVALFVQPVTIGGLLLGLRWGIEGVAAAHVMVVFLILVPAWLVPFRLIGLRLAEFARAIAPILGAGLVAGLAMWATLALLARVDGAGPFWLLAACVPVGVAAYLGALLLVDPMVVRQAKAFLGHLRPASGGPMRL